MRVLISPTFAAPDQGDGGIRRVVEAQRKYLPDQGIEIVEREADADLVAIHAGSYVATNKPVVAHNHGMYWSDHGWDRWSHDLNRAVINVLRRCDAATAPSDWVGYIIRRGMNIPARTIYHGIDANEWGWGDKAIPYVLWNKTRVDAICDPTPVTEAAKRLPNVPFVSTYGDADLRNVRVTGKLPFAQAQILIQNSSVYLATARETFGIGVLEAMASGSVVVGYDWGGQKEIITNGVDGILVPPGDYNALAAAVAKALDAPTDYRTAAANTIQDRFTWERAAAFYASTYREVLERSQLSGPRTSVVITCYNLGEMLPRAVESVRQQQDQDWEIVIVDDASPDNTADVAQRLAHVEPRIKVVTNPSNLYLAGSLDVGVQAATGRYIVPLDADNELAPGALSTLAGVLDDNSDIDVAYGSMTVVQEWPGGITQTSGWPGDFVYEQQMAHRNQIPSTSLYRRKWHERAGGYRRRCRTAEDADFWCRITSLGAQPRKVTPAPTLIYHERRESMSHVERDWPWQAWYTWSRIPDLTPWGAPASTSQRRIPTLEPAEVTVVIPVGPSHAKLLPDALDSVYAQTFLNWRCIVVDDRPGAANWADPLKLPPWASLWVSGGPGAAGGPARARNTGIYATETPYVLLLDADDYLAPNALEILLQTAKDRANPNEYYYSDWYKQEEGKVYKASDFVIEHMRLNLTHSITALYPTRACIAVGGFDEALDAWEDWDFILRLIQAGNCGVHVPFPLLYYRYKTGQRREELYARRETAMVHMRAKWHKLMVEKAPMACGCSGGRTTYSPPVVVGDTPIPVSRDGETLVEFTGTSAPRTYRGQRKEYRFGSDTGHRAHYVRNEDLPIFKDRPGYRLAVADSAGMAILEALGPPDREAELVPA